MGYDTTYDEDGQLIFLDRAPKTALQIIKEAEDLTRKSKESNVMEEAFMEKGYIGEGIAIGLSQAGRILRTDGLLSI